MSTFIADSVVKKPRKEIAVHRLKTINVWLVAATALILVLLIANQIWSRSVDFAHHYTLVTRLMEQGGVGSAPDPTLGEMQVYPRLSHWMAALAGKPFQSPVWGMQAIALAAILLIWLSCGSILCALRGRNRIVAVALMCLLLFVNHRYLHLQIFGKEIDNDYFFAQLVAQALLLCAVAIALHIERSGRPRWQQYLFTLLAIPAIESAHLLPAIEALGFFGVILLADVLAEFRRVTTPPQRGKLLLQSALFLVIGVAIVVLHPIFQVMRTISENNGDLFLYTIQSIRNLLMLAAVVGALSCALLLRWLLLSDEGRRSMLPLKYIGALGLACSVLCFAQWLALQLGQGSEYACKKYVYALTSLLLVEIPLLVIRTRNSNDTSHSDTHDWPLTTGILLSVFLLVSVLSIRPAHIDMRVSTIRKLEGEVRRIGSESTLKENGKHAIAVHLMGSNSMIDYMFSIAHLRAPRDALAYSILLTKPITEFSEVSSIVTRRDDDKFDVTSCREASATADLVLISAACYKQAR
jgi:hypothetical protein